MIAMGMPQLEQTWPVTRQRRVHFGADARAELSDSRIAPDGEIQSALDDFGFLSLLDTCH